MKKTTFAAGVVSALALTVGSLPIEAQTCTRTSVKDPTPFLGNGGEVIILADGTIWKDSSFKYLYLYAYNPIAIICAADGKLIVNGHEFSVTKIGSTDAASGKASPRPRNRE